MEGDLDVESVEANVTRLTLNATYDPPLGRLGEIIDRTVVHGLADRTIKDFLQRVVEKLDAQLAKPCPGSA